MDKETLARKTRGGMLILVGAVGTLLFVCLCVVLGVVAEMLLSKLLSYTLIVLGIMASLVIIFLVGFVSTE